MLALACSVGCATAAGATAIVNVGSGLCLSGTGADGAIVLARCVGGTDQRFTATDDGTLRLYGVLCLDGAPKGSGLKKNTLVATLCDGSDEQAWIHDQASSRLTYGKKCAAVNRNGQAAGDVLRVTKCKNAPQSQQFALLAEGTPVEQCFGSAGPGCGKAVDLKKAKKGRRKKDGTQKVKVSVGTIAHSNCCRLRPNGYHCQGPESGEDQTNCLPEWWQAERDFKLGRFWKHTFGPYTADSYGDDLAGSSGRDLALPAKPGTGKDSCNDTVIKSTAAETAVTLAILAPKGTKLDCTDDAFCASGTARQVKGKDHIVCNDGGDKGQPSDSVTPAPPSPGAPPAPLT